MSYQYVNTKVFHLTGEVLLFRLRLSSDCEGGADPEEILYLRDRKKRGIEKFLNDHRVDIFFFCIILCCRETLIYSEWQLLIPWKQRFPIFDTLETAFPYIFFERVMRSKPRAARLAEQAFRCSAVRPIAHGIHVRGYAFNYRTV